MTELILMRHGKTANSDIYCGSTDVPLSCEGKKEAERTVLLLPKFDFVYCSDMKRAKQTVKIITPDAKTIYSKSLREIDFGDFEGLTASDISKRMPDEWKSYMDDFAEFTFPQGDSAREYFEGAVKTAKDIVQIHKDKKILIVSHKGFIASILSFYLHGDMAHMFTYEIRTSGFARLCIYDGAAVLGHLY